MTCTVLICTLVNIPYAKAAAKKNPSNEKTTEQHIYSLHGVKTPFEHSKALVRVTTKLTAVTHENHQMML